MRKCERNRDYRRQRQIQLRISGTEVFDHYGDKAGWLSNEQTATATINAVAEPSPTKIFVSTAGRIHVTVMDSAGAPVPNASVILAGGQLRQSKTVLTDNNGVYDSNWVGIGNYSADRDGNRPHYAKFTSQR